MAIRNRHEQGNAILHNHSGTPTLDIGWLGFTFYIYSMPGVFSSVFDPLEKSFTTDDGQTVGLSTIADY